MSGTAERRMDLAETHNPHRSIATAHLCAPARESQHSQRKKGVIETMFPSGTTKLPWDESRASPNSNDLINAELAGRSSLHRSDA